MTAASKSTTLYDLSPGQSGVIRSVGNNSGAVKRRLIDMGLTPGTKISVNKIAPLGDPLEVSLRGYTLSLRRADAAQITMLEEQSACGSCGGCAAGKGCVFGGVVNEAIEKAKTADGFVFGSPVHYASASGNMTSFMDRLAYAGGRYLAYKPAAICCSARRAGTTTTLDQLVKYPQFFHMPLVNGSYWAMVHGSNAEQVLQDAEGCAVMQELGRNMAWLLHCIEAGRAAGFEHPQNPKRPMTNFIR